MTKWSVRIRTEDGERTLDDAELETFVPLWQAKERNREKTSAYATGKVESFWVESPDGGARWLYERSGRVWVLAKHVVPFYIIPDVDVFNELMGFQ